MIELVVAFGVVIIVGAAWNEQRWDRSPLGRASSALRRRRPLRPIERLHLIEWATLAAVGLCALAWALGVAP
jgi:hypothetical protein